MKKKTFLNLYMFVTCTGTAIAAMFLLLQGNTMSTIIGIVFVGLLACLLNVWRFIPIMLIMASLTLASCQKEDSCYVYLFTNVAQKGTLIKTEDITLISNDSTAQALYLSMNRNRLIDKPDTTYLVFTGIEEYYDCPE